jgi:hypothetical protein
MNLDEGMSMKKYLPLILALIVFAIIHEGLHAVIAYVNREYGDFQVKPFGLEVIFTTPVEERSGLRWGFISGVSNIATILLGYLLFAFINQFQKHSNDYIRSFFYWLIIFFLLVDPLNISIGLLLYGGDANGIAVGFGVNRWLVQGIFFILLILNRELAAQKIIPAYGIKTSHPLFKPWIAKH